MLSLLSYSVSKETQPFMNNKHKLNESKIKNLKLFQTRDDFWNNVPRKIKLVFVLMIPFVCERIKLCKIVEKDPGGFFETIKSPTELDTN